MTTRTAAIAISADAVHWRHVAALRWARLTGPRPSVTSRAADRGHYCGRWTRNPPNRRNQKNTQSGASQMWGGRFAAGPAAIMQQINASIDVDKRLYKEDIEGSLAHAAMLVKQGILTQADGDAIADGLARIRKEIDQGKFEFQIALEDIHMNVESRLKELIGDAAGRLHTARSRNDQVATDFRLWVRARDRRHGGRAEGPDPRADRPRRGACRDGDAGLHASAAGAARHLRPSSDGLCGDAGPRSRPPRRLPRAAERMPAGRRRARRHVVSDRSRTRRPRRSASTGRPPIRWTACRAATSRWNIWRRCRSSARICRASPKRS